MSVRRAPTSSRRLEIVGGHRSAGQPDRSHRYHPRDHRVRGLARRQGGGLTSPAARSTRRRSSSAPPSGSRRPPSRNGRSASRPTGRACCTPPSATARGTSTARSHRRQGAGVLQRHGAEGESRGGHRRPRSSSPAFSPDGKEVAYLEERTTLKVINLDVGQVAHDPGRETATTRMSTAINGTTWSPDGKWFAVTFLEYDPLVHEVRADSFLGRREAGEHHPQRLRRRPAALGRRRRAAALVHRQVRRQKPRGQLARVRCLRRVPDTQSLGPLQARPGVLRSDC